MPPSWTEKKTAGGGKISSQALGTIPPEKLIFPDETVSPRA
jgi:hypothetical protein